MITVSEVALEWWAEKQKTVLPGERPYYQSFLDLYVLRFLGGESISSITPERMDAYFSQLLFEQHYRNAPERKMTAYGKSILQEIFDFAEVRGYAEGLPRAELTYRINQIKREAFHGCPYSKETIEQIERLIIAEMAEPVGLAMSFAWYAGLSREEILSLTSQDIDFQNGCIHVNGRKIPMEDRLEKILLAYKDWTPVVPNQYIFISRKKTRFAGPSMALLVRNSKELHGIEDPAVNLTGLRNNYILRKLESIRTEDLPALADSLDVSPIWLLSKFGNFLTPAKKQLTGVNALYRWSCSISGRASVEVDREIVEAVYDSMWKVIARALVDGETVSLDGIGLFYIREPRERYERSWLNFEFFKVRERRQLVFHPHPSLLLSINFNTE